MLYLLAESRVHPRKPSVIMKVTKGRVCRILSKWGFMSFVEEASGIKREGEGSLSVLSMPDGMPGMFSGKGRSMIVALVSERDMKMKGRFAGVVKMVTLAFR